MKRTFIAVPVEASGQLKNLLISLQEKMKGEAIKWVEPWNLHITLKFLGDTPENLIGSISEKLESVLSGFGKMEGTMTGIDSFSKHGNPFVLFTQLVGMPELDFLSEQIGKELEIFAFPSDQNKFNAHLTLGRIKYLRNKRKYYTIVDSMKSVEIQPVIIEKVVFFESWLQPRGPVYIPLKTIMLSRVN